MRLKTWHVLKAVALIGLMNAAAATAYATEASYYASNEIASLREHIEALHAQLDADSYDDGIGSCYNDCCRDWGWFVGAELAFLKPYNGNGTGMSSIFALAGTPNVGGVDTDYDASPRFWFGYQNCDGLGIRFRYWEFDQYYSAAANGAAIGGGFNVDSTAFHSFDTWVFDAEVIDSSKLGCNWDVTYSAGLRYLQYTEVAGITSPGASLIVADHIDALGLTASIELRRDVTCRLGIFGIARGSILYGDESDTFVGGVVTDDTQLNDVKAIYEIQLGIEYIKPTCYGSYFVRAGVEAQYWAGFGVDNQPLTRGNRLLPSSNTSSGFVGGFFAVGFNR